MGSLRSGNYKVSHTHIAKVILHLPFLRFYSITCLKHNATMPRHEEGRSVCIIGHSKLYLKVVVQSNLLLTVFLPHSDFFFFHGTTLSFSSLLSELISWFVCQSSRYFVYCFHKQLHFPQTFATSRQLLFKKENEMKNRNPQSKTLQDFPC